MYSLVQIDSYDPNPPVYAWKIDKLTPRFLSAEQDEVSITETITWRAANKLVDRKASTVSYAGSWIGDAGGPQSQNKEA